MHIMGINSDISNKNLISLKVVSDYIDLNYNSINKNNLNNIEILIVKLSEISYDTLKISKINCNNSLIYSISFLADLEVHIKIGTLVKPIYYQFLVSHSFTNSNDTYNPIIEAINLDVAFIQSKINFYVTYAFLDEVICSTGNLYDNLNSSYGLEDSQNNIDFSNYTYIDISKEFI